jgi:hypothetical protein
VGRVVYMAGKKGSLKTKTWFTENKDSFHAFIRERCVIGDGLYAKPKNLHDAYCDYIIANGESPYQYIGEQTFYKCVQSTGAMKVRVNRFTPKLKIEFGGGVVFSGIALK